MKYKQKPGRDLALLRSELLRLMGFIERLDVDVAASADWGALRAAVAQATRKSELRRAEDPVDAVLCAYIARFATDRPADVTVYGEPATGCIVTPTLR